MIRILFGHGYDEMGYLAVAQKHITDKVSFFDDFLEPRGLPVAFARQLEGADISDMQAFCIKNPKIHKCLGDIAQILKNLLQIFSVHQNITAPYGFDFIISEFKLRLWYHLCFADSR